MEHQRRKRYHHDQKISLNRKTADFGGFRLSKKAQNAKRLIQRIQKNKLLLIAILFILIPSTQRDPLIFQGVSSFSPLGSLPYLCTPTRSQRRNLHPSRQSEAACRYFIDKLKPPISAVFSSQKTLITALPLLTA